LNPSYSKHYRDINFDTLRDRHDNFSFQKVIQMKNKLNDTMHFSGILENPITPKLILFQRQVGSLMGRPGALESSYFSQGARQPDTFYKDLSPSHGSQKEQTGQDGVPETNNLVVSSGEKKPADVIKAKKEAEKAMWKEFHHHFT
jgi:hypothetical protein